MLIRIIFIIGHAISFRNVVSLCFGRDVRMMCKGCESHLNDPISCGLFGDVGLVWSRGFERVQRENRGGNVGVGLGYEWVVKVRVLIFMGDSLCFVFGNIHAFVKNDAH